MVIVFLFSLSSFISSISSVRKLKFMEMEWLIHSEQFGLGRASTQTWPPLAFSLHIFHDSYPTLKFFIHILYLFLIHCKL